MHILSILLYFIIFSDHVFAMESPGSKWVLVNTTTNPNNLPEKFIVGVTPDYYSPRFEGSFEIYDISSSFIKYNTKWVDRNNTHYNLQYTASLKELPNELKAGENVTLKATISGEGDSGDYGSACSAALRFEYRASGIRLQGNTKYTICMDFKGGDVTPSFVVPEPYEGGEIIISAFLWNCGACLVEWVYKAEPEYGVIEKDGKLFLVSPPDGPLIISTSDLPEWAGPKMVTVGAVIVNVGPPDTVQTGDPMILLDGKPVARLNDLTAHGGNIVEGSDKIFVNGIPAAFGGGFAVCPLVTGRVPHVGGPIVCEKTTSELCRSSFRTLDEPAVKGSKVLEVDGEGIEIGDAVVIGSGSDEPEAARVAGKGSLILDRPLSRDHPAGTLVTRVPDNYTDLVPPSTGTEKNDNLKNDTITESGPGTIALILIIFIAVSFLGYKKMRK